ncbi:hypothetical protein CDV31_004060 [Fusarium ambrosium]|uniref:Uncharacterized protein n=1 Tax=Fusarium ambrosium TaxID=131363 RepID=A0A428USC9_9HYPO|nr:hypothetical protein CDV31_004060 [Fusarium ambrosium]
MRIHNAYFDSSRATPIENPPSLPSITENFYFGSIQALEEDHDGHDESEPMLRPPPTINKEDAEYISSMGNRIEQKYTLLLGRTASLKANSFKKLRYKAESQKGRIDIQVRVIKQWDSSILEPQDAVPDYRMSPRIEELRTRFRDIHDKLNDAVDELPRSSKRGQSPAEEGRIKSSRVCKSPKSPKSPEAIETPVVTKRTQVVKNLTDLFDKIELHIVAIGSHVYHLSASPSPFESTKGFGTLFVSSSATRTLYRHLCQACPLNSREQVHCHTALVGLVPEKEPECIVPDDVAITTHHVAIESTFHQGHYIWFEAHSVLRLPAGDSEAVCSEPSSPVAVVVDGLRERLRRDSGYSSTSDSWPREQVQLDRESYHIKVCPGSLAQGGEGVAMCIGNNQESGCHEMLYLDKDKRPDTSRKPLNLSDILHHGEERWHQRDPHLFKRSHRLKDDRYKIAFKVAEAALRYGWREWLGDAWGLRDIEFYPYESERMPFLRAKIFKHGCGKLEKFMSKLGFVLLQVGLWERLIHDKDLENQLSRLGTNTSTEFQEAVRYCVEFATYGDYHGDDNDFQQTFYQKVISPLRETAKAVERESERYY